ncbi:MAG: RHS repeat domain-containing protein [Deltaproteobacteria bacterium]|nr:RHS repeat domain-containing protein [Deltaproteobacteria bacterium]
MDHVCGLGLQLFILVCLFCRGDGDYTYDDLNRLLQVEYDDGTVIEYVYDEVGNRLQRVSLWE